MTTRSFLALFSLALSVILGLLLGTRGAPSADAASASERSRRPRIGLSMDTLKEARWQSDRNTFVKRAQELGAEVLVQAANSDDAKQMADVKALLTSQIDVLVVVAHDGKAMAEAVRLAHAEGVPVVAYDRPIRDAELDLYVSFDNIRVGRLQASYLVERFRPSSERPLRLVRIHGAPTDENSSVLKRAQDEVLAPLIERGEVKVLLEDWADDWKRENAKRIMNAAITQHGGNFDAVLAANDGTAGGAIQALEEEGLLEGRVVTGQDADLDAVQRIQRGAQAMTIYKPLSTLASGAADAAVALAKRKPLIARAGFHNGTREVPAILYDVVTVTRDNLRDTVIRDGFHSEAAVYGSPVAQP